MKEFLVLTEYNLRAIRKPLLWTMLLLGPVEFAVMLVGMALRRGPLFAPPSTFYLDGMFVTAFCMVAAMLLNFAACSHQSGRSRAMYTLMTLPVRRSEIYFSGVLSGLLAIGGVIAAQALWFLILYAPLGWVNDLFSRYYLQLRVEAGLLPALPGYSSFLHNGLFLSQLRTRMMNILMPLSPVGAVYLLLCILGPLCSLQSILYRRRGLKILHIAVFFYDAFFSLVVLFLASANLAGETDLLLVALVLAHQLVVVLAVSVSACRSLKKARNL